MAIPGGFAVSSKAYDAVLDRYQLRERLQLLLQDVDVTKLESLAEIGRQVSNNLNCLAMPIVLFAYLI